MDLGIKLEYYRTYFQNQENFFLSGKDIFWGGRSVIVFVGVEFHYIGQTVVLKA